MGETGLSWGREDTVGRVLFETEGRPGNGEEDDTKYLVRAKNREGRKRDKETEKKLEEKLTEAKEVEKRLDEKIAMIIALFIL